MGKIICWELSMVSFTASNFVTNGMPHLRRWGVYMLEIFEHVCSGECFEVILGTHTTAYNLHRQSLELPQLYLHVHLPSPKPCTRCCKRSDSGMHFNVLPMWLHKNAKKHKVIRFHGYLEKQTFYLNLTMKVNGSNIESQ